MIKGFKFYALQLQNLRLVFTISLLECLIILLSGCATIYNPATGKNELIFIDTASEVNLGKIIVSQIKGEYKISKDHFLKNRLETIGQRLAIISDRQDLNYLFDIIEDKELNAFATPGGFVFVNSGLMEKADDDELAGVLGHEIGHIAARHSIKKMQATLGYQIIIGLAFGKGGSADLGRAVDTVFNLVSLGYSREDERLADRLAVKYTYKAGYSPRAIIRFLHKLKDEQDKQGPQLKLVFLSSHPPLEERIKNIEGEIIKLEGKTQNNNTPPAPLKNNGIQAKLNNGNTVSDRVTFFKTSCNQAKKICPLCKKKYSTRYNFCPCDGKELVCPDI